MHYDAYDRYLRSELLEQLCENASKRAQRPRSGVYYAYRVPKATGATMPVYRHRRFAAVVLYIPFQF